MTSQATCTPAEAASRLGLSRQMVYRLVKEGKLLAIRVGSKYRLIVADLEDALRTLAASESQAVAERDDGLGRPAVPSAGTEGWGR